MSKKQIIYDMDGNEIGVSNEQSRPITSSIETIEEINQVVAPTAEKDYDLKRNGKKLLKTDIDYVYKLVDNTGFVYRLYHKETNTDTWQMIDPSTKGKVDKKGKKIKGRPFSSKTAAAEHLHTELVRMNSDPSHKNRGVTFGEVWEMFLQSPHGRAFETIRRYSSIYNHHIKTVFGNRPIKNIPAEDYNEYFIKMHRVGDGAGAKKNGYSYQYVQSILKYIYLVVDYAYKKHIISAEDYTRFQNEIKMPDKKKATDRKAIRVLSNEQIKQISDMLNGTDFYLPFLISLLGGLRPAETFALCFSDFDYDKNTVSITKQFVEETNGKRILKQPKTEGSTRTIELPVLVIKEVQKREKALAEARAKEPLVFEQNKMQVIDGRNFTEELIEQPDFINLDGKGRLIPAHSFSYWTKQIKKTVCPNEDGLEDFSFYTFRKTHLSNMASNNCPIGELMRRAGHTKMETLYEYYYNRTDESEKKLHYAINAMARLV